MLCNFIRYYQNESDIQIESDIFERWIFYLKRNRLITFLKKKKCWFSFQFKFWIQNFALFDWRHILFPPLCITSKSFLDKIFNTSDQRYIPCWWDGFIIFWYFFGLDFAKSWRGNVISSVCLMSVCLSLSVCMRVCEQNSRRTDAPMWKKSQTYDKN